MSQAGIAYRVQQLGAEGVRQRIAEINTEIKAGAPITKDLKKEMSELSTQVGAQERLTRLNTQAWKANHTTLLDATKVMSGIGSAARTAMVVTSAWSLASLAFSHTSSGLLEARQQLSLAEAKLKDAMNRGADQETISALEESVNSARVKVKEFEDQEMQQLITTTTNAIATFAVMGSSITQMATKFGPMISGLLATKVEMVALSPAISVASVSTRTFSGALQGVYAALGPIGLAIIALSIAIPLLIQYWPEITAAFNGFISWLGATFVPAFKAIWNSLRPGFVAFWNGLITFTNAAVNAILAGVEGLANGFIAVVNGMISAYNAVASLLGLGGISRLGNITLPRVSIPVITAAKGFNGDVTQPTLFLTGEKGKEHVTVTPSNGSAGGGSGNVYITVQGDVTGEELIDKVRMRIKDNLRYKKGFTGF